MYCSAIVNCLKTGTFSHQLFFKFPAIEAYERHTHMKTLGICSFDFALHLRPLVKSA